MPRTRNEEAQNVADLLEDYEVTIEAALIKGAQLAAQLPISRQRAQFAVGVSHEALSRLVASVSTLTVARGEAAQTHALLEGTREHFGLTIRAGGDKENSPPPGGIGRDEPQPIHLAA